MRATLIIRIDIKATLGEGVTWDHRTGAALWTDIQGHCLYQYNVSRKELQKTEFEERLTAFGLTTDSDWLIAAFESGFAWLHHHTGEVRWIERPEAGQTGRRFNDGRVGPCGRFWCGTMVEDAEKSARQQGALYSLTPGGAVEKAFDGVSISNGLAWSPDGGTMYFADSPQQTIWAFAYCCETGALSNRRVFAKTPAGVYPDGATVDNEGGLWSAQWGGSRVVRYAPDGSIDAILEIEASQPSCVAFGGDDMDMLIVTTARENLTPAALAAEPNAGDVFIYKTEYKGAPSTAYAGSPPDRAAG